MNRKVIAVAGLGFGDEGKGSVTDYLCRKYDIKHVIRYNGGAQAAHNVVTKDQHHTFAQFGAGSFLPSVFTHLSKYMIVNPGALLNEATDLPYNPLFRLSVDREALVTTPVHILLNKKREQDRGNQRHGSCGMGIGETVKYNIDYPDLSLRVKDLQTKNILLNKVRIQNEIVKNNFDICCTEEEIDYFIERCQQFIESGLHITDSAYLRHVFEHQQENILFEGAQGVLLDENVGFTPYNTWTDTTFNNVYSLLEEANYDDPIKKLGLLRVYPTRHGPGPFPTESDKLDHIYSDDHNVTGTWQGKLRTGYFDLQLMFYALRASNIIKDNSKIDPDFSLGFTHIDKLSCNFTYSDYVVPKKFLSDNGLWKVFGTPEITEFLLGPHKTENVTSTFLSFKKWLSTFFEIEVKLESMGAMAEDKTDSIWDDE
jgi:adenylosuccinate synthase